MQKQIAGNLQISDCCPCSYSQRRALWVGKQEDGYLSACRLGSLGRPHDNEDKEAKEACEHLP